MGFAKLSLKGRALKLLSMREHSRLELERKLAAHVQEGEQLAPLLDDLERRGFISADGLRIPDLLDAILPLFELDAYVPDPLVMMAAVEGDTLDPSVEQSYRVPILKHAPAAPEIKRIDRFAFYDRAKAAYAVLMTGETAKYGNIILKKGVTPLK